MKFVVRVVIVRFLQMAHTRALQKVLTSDHEPRLPRLAV